MWELSERTIGEWLEHRANENPNDEYLIYPELDLRWNFKNFNERVDRLAKGLLAIGVRKYTHVGIWAPNIPDWVTMFFACSKIGAITITVNTSFKQFEVEDLCRKSDMEILCIIDHEKDNNFLEMTYRMLPELRTLPQGGILQSEKLPHMKKVIFMGSEHHKGLMNLVEIMAQGMSISDEEYVKVKKECSCFDAINIQYTSGTTGFPKGAMLSHFGICNNGYLTGVHLDFTSKTKLCLCVPLFHCFGLVLGVLNCLLHGCAMVIVKRYDPLLVLSCIHNEKCTSLYGVPTMYIELLNNPMFKQFKTESLHAGIMAGSICPVNLMEEVENKMKMIITTEYGLTEASPGMTASRWYDTKEVRYHTVGKEFEHSEVRVLDKEGNECPVGVEGEMCNRGYNNMLGYYNDPEATSQIIDKNGWLHSGDLGYKDENGDFHITGRIKDMIIRGGENIYPSEIETFLQTMPEIKIVQIVGVPSKKYGESVGAFIMLNEGCSLTETDVQEYCRDQIARYKVPKYIFFVDKFPLTGSGKIQKFKLRELSVQLCNEKGIEII